MLRLFLTIISLPSLALCAMSTYLWLDSMAHNNYWDTPALMHLGRVPAVFVAFNSAIIPAVTAWLWIRGHHTTRP